MYLNRLSRAPAFKPWDTNPGSFVMLSCFADDQTLNAQLLATIFLVFLPSRLLTLFAAISDFLTSGA